MMVWLCGSSVSWRHEPGRGCVERSALRIALVRVIMWLWCGFGACLHVAMVRLWCVPSRTIHVGLVVWKFRFVEARTGAGMWVSIRKADRFSRVMVGYGAWYRAAMVRAFMHHTWSFDGFGCSVS